MFWTGYRYELYCASKAARTTQCTIYCAISSDAAWTFNQQKTEPDVVEVKNGTEDSLNNSSVPYTREIFDALKLRYEEPISNNRWDSPLITILPDMETPVEDIYSALYEKKPPPPNLATQNVRFASRFNKKKIWIFLIYFTGATHID